MKMILNWNTAHVPDVGKYGGRGGRLDTVGGNTARHCGVDVVMMSTERIGGPDFRIEDRRQRRRRHHFRRQ